MDMKKSLPTEVYYLLLNGAKQYFKNKEDAEEMAKKLSADGLKPGSVYTENDPEEIQDLYDVGYLKDDDYEIVNDKSLDAIKDNFTPPGAKSQKEDVKDEIDTNDNGEIEVDEMADFQKSLDDYASKNKKGRDDIPVTTRR